MNRIAGVDACKGGWLVATTDEWPVEKPKLRVCQTFKEVILEIQARDVGVAVVDIPIGLPEGESERSCDTQARRALCDKQVLNAHSRVFRTPPRSALEFLEW